MMEPPPSPPSSSSTPTISSPSLGDLSLPLASQPDIVLAAEKDLFYTKQIKDMLTEVLERLLGARKAELLSPEIGLLADLCYYGLTMPGGSQTLGQEYCTLTLAKEQHQPRPLPAQAQKGTSSSNDSSFFLPLSASRRAVAIMGAGGLTYVAQRVLHRGGWHGDWSRLMRGPALRPRLSGQGGGGVPAAVIATEGDQGSSGRWRRSVAGWRRIRDAWQSGCAHYHQVLEAFLPESREAAVRALQKLHLMLFFLYGRYYTVAWRLAGARTLTTARVSERRASYTVLGMMLAMQMGLRLISALRLGTKELLALRAREGEGGAEVSSSDGSGRSGGRVPSGALSHEGHPGQQNATPSGGDSEEEERRKCSLCMGPRKLPSATPCGHVFCWDCIMNWCQSRAECPLCRHAALPQTILHVVNFTP